MPEVDEATLAQLANLDAFTRRALATPATRRKMLEIQKTLNPDVAIPEIDESDPVRNELRELKAELAKEREERATNENNATMLARWNEGRAFARKKGYSDEGLEKIEAFMQERGIVSHEDAIPAYEVRNPPPVPAVGSGTRWDFFGPQQDDTLDMKLLYEGKDEEFLQKTIADTLNRVRSGEIRR